jgi:branched-chain amino acid transport system substrate-binding protein
MTRRKLLAVGAIWISVLGARSAEAEILVGVAGPMTGAIAWFGEQYLRAVDLAVENLNANGGVLGESVSLAVGDDFCDPDQAVAVARKLAGDGIVFVAGHFCSHSSIPASKVYEEAGILQIAPGSASAILTEEGGPSVFRICGRDDRQGTMVGDYLADHWADKKIAVLDDGTTWGRGVANGVRARLHERGVPVAMDETFTPNEPEYSSLVARMQASSIDVFFPGGLHRDTGLIFRQARERNYDVHLVSSSSSATGDFPLIAGPGLDGTLMAGATDARRTPQAAEVVAQFRAQGYEPVGYTLFAYAAVQVWAEAVEAAGTLELGSVVEIMHSRQFDTVLGTIGFDEKGDVTGFDPWQWYVWQEDGTYVPLEPGLAQH